MHTNMWTHEVKSISGSKYFLLRTFKDNFNKMTFIFPQNKRLSIGML